MRHTCTVRGVCPALAHLPAIDWWNRASHSHAVSSASPQPVILTLIRPPRSHSYTSQGLHSSLHYTGNSYDRTVSRTNVGVERGDCHSSKTRGGACCSAALCITRSMTGEGKGACCSQALDLFRQRTGSGQHYRIQLEKNVPHGEPHQPCHGSPPCLVNSMLPHASYTSTLISLCISRIIPSVQAYGCR